jgi:F-type H+-transporting ATPase subunit epsilon
MPIRCEIVSQDRMVFEGDADTVIIPGVFGEMGVLPKHAPLLSTMGFGVIRVRQGEREEVFTVAGGVVEVQPDVVTVLADVAENVLEIDISRAQAARDRIEALMEEGPPPDPDAYLKMEAALRRSKLRIEAANRYKKGRRTSLSPMLEDETPS